MFQRHIDRGLQTRDHGPRTTDYGLRTTVKGRERAREHQCRKRRGGGGRHAVHQHSHTRFQVRNRGVLFSRGATALRYVVIIACEEQCCRL